MWLPCVKELLKFQIKHKPLHQKDGMTEGVRLREVNIADDG
jgi:hypothetical protein